MTLSDRNLSARGGFAAASFLIFLVLLALLLFAPPDGIEHAPLLQFVGRFHPLSVHFPIAVLLLVPLFESLARKRSSPRLVPRKRWRIFRPIGSAAYVGWSVCCGCCLAVLVAALACRITRTGPSLRNYARGHGDAGFVYGLSRRTVVSRR